MMRSLVLSVALATPGCAGSTDQGAVPGATSSSGAGGSGCTQTGCNPAAGVPQLGCALGFGWLEDGSCAPLLPVMPCPAGLVALLGQTYCHELSPCGGTYGSAPVEPITRYVDAAAPGPHDGTSVHPFNTVGEAVANALPGAVIAIATGSYPGVVLDKPVRLWGRCPSKVSIASLTIGDDAPGAEVHDLAIASPASVTGAQGVVLDRVWIHGGALALALDGAQVTVARSLIEGASTSNVQQRAGTLTLVNTTVRGGEGGGIEASYDTSSKTRASLTLDHVIVEASGKYGVRIIGADSTMSASVIRDTRPIASAAPNQQLGWGLAIEPHVASGQGSAATVKHSVISGSCELGVMVRGSKASFERVTIRDTKERADKTRGYGLVVQAHTASKQPSLVDVTASLVAGNRALGVLVAGATFTATGLAVRDTSASSDGNFGDGLAAFGVAVPTLVTLKSARIERSERAGASVFGATLAIGASRISCAAFDLDRETHGAPGQIDDAGGNVCGCKTTGPCKSVSSNLTPPTPVED